jgi:hypothetical protein
MDQPEQTVYEEEPEPPSMEQPKEPSEAQPETPMAENPEAQSLQEPEPHEAEQPIEENVSEDQNEKPSSISDQVPYNAPYNPTIQDTSIPQGEAVDTPVQVVMSDPSQLPIPNRNNISAEISSEPRIQNESESHSSQYQEYDPITKPQLQSQPHLQNDADAELETQDTGIVSSEQDVGNGTIEKVLDERGIIEEKISKGFKIVEKLPEYIDIEEEVENLNNSKKEMELNNLNQAKILAEKSVEKISNIYKQLISTLKMLKVTKNNIIEAKERGVEVNMATKVFDQAKNALKMGDFKNAEAFSNLCETLLNKKLCGN